MVLLHGSIKKTQATPMKELKLAERRMKEYGRYGEEKSASRLNA